MADLRRLDLRVLRAGFAVALQLFDRGRGSLDHDFDGSIGEVASPAADACSLRALSHGVPEEDALDSAVDDDSAADRIAWHPGSILAPAGSARRRSSLGPAMSPG